MIHVRERDESKIIQTLNLDEEAKRLFAIVQKSEEKLLSVPPIVHRHISRSTRTSADLAEGNTRMELVYTQRHSRNAVFHSPLADSSAEFSSRSC